ncbi:DNA-invertase hin [Paraburkholderia aspalathi]|uniref:recombinase family protein n=1 Tax=Paraburkholderia aspalathi TaxID=1324617 RepID=UPI00190E4D6D|nr:recombinase family protein [Paraburkholderia aspalathi]MBK3844492.1 recombinase family protein [Paraburkholderia aspalathi]CAE6872670.1 DNA-invertase hin [Paraburkholderia aspalathi]CAE6873314.1 DNA-invertase hin [Paraburkholderia aspalathi]
MIIGYARVSTEEQNLALQVLALEAVGCVKIYTDQGVSGSQTQRPGLERALRRIKSGDKLVVWRLDRLGRSLSHLIHLMALLERRQVCFCSVTEQLDTSTCSGRLIFHIMGALAEFERVLISERTRAGMAAARARGQTLGRPASLTPQQCRQASRLLLEQGYSIQTLAQRYSVHPRTLLRLMNRVIDGDDTEK